MIVQISKYNDNVGQSAEFYTGIRIDLILFMANAKKDVYFLVNVKDF
jgi:hypothetical protein